MLISQKSCALLKEKISLSQAVYCKGLFLSARWFVFSQVVRKGTQLIVMPDRESAEYTCSDLYALLPGDNVFILSVSGKNIEKSNYKSTLGVQRTAALSRLMEKNQEFSVIVTYPEALEEGVPALKQIKSSVLSVRKGDEINYETLKELLAEKGFEKVDFVSAPGQYAIRGSIVDIFSYSDNHPYRLSFWGDEVESIHTFNANTQLSIAESDAVKIIADLSAGSRDGLENILNLLPKDCTVWLDSSDIYKEKPFFPLTGKYRRVYLDIPVGADIEDPVLFHIQPQPVFNKNFELLEEDIRSRIENGYSVTIFGDKEAQLGRLRSILGKEGGVLPQFETGKTIHRGFIDTEDKICCYSDHEIFDRFQRVSLRRTVEKSEQLTLNDLNAFNVGDYIVHIDHGIGIFGGLVRLKDEYGRVREVVKITYKDGDVVFVSVHALHKISLYRSREGEPPKINKLGSKTWVTLKNSAKSRIKDIAKDLIQLYARRRAAKGFAFSPDSYLQEELESSFMYEDTPDQELATKSVKEDMEDDCPMDRLICGDVGFGKTEIAIRAAFKAVSDGKQVAVLVPTTILSLQHYNTFSERLKDFPCSVDYVSRLRSTKEIARIREDLSAGRIDILIGTHKILGKGFEFKDLGLLIIDEEQKFGVSAKEKLRQLKTNVDTLTLTATPIPRTLQFSLLGARDLSIINTPPPNRIPVQTESILFDDSEIRNIIRYELNRGGQIFFLHNKVEELDSIHDILHRLVPDMKICVAHGKMESTELENRVMDFMRGEYDLLLCTTIIENGLDIPNANTILINQAQNIGLSDLHQLRGRVGRSNRKAFCYLIVPPLAGITEDARRRLKAIEEFSDLGSGFNIAMQDLDIRGAGNLLGAEQSGFIVDMGFETYQKILAEAMEELGVESGISTKRGRRDVYVEECTIETDQPAFIPDDYIDITAEKIRIYKQLDLMKSDREVDLFAQRLQDRFGKFSPEVENLLTVVRIRNLGAALGFEKIIIKNGMLIMFFISNQMTKYYESPLFASVLQHITANPATFALKQTDDKLKTVSRGVDSLQTALNIIGKLI